jgi:hypothetical protein
MVQSILYGGRWWLPPSPGHGEWSTLNIQNITLKKLHGNITMWNFKNHILTTDVSQLTNVRK